MIRAAILLLALPVTAWAADGPTLYKRCAACHLPTGAGVPGAYPPLKADVRALAGKVEGRRYLILAVTRGLAGPITVEGKAYRGVMPAQVLKDDEVAAVLNHVVTTIAGGKGAFSADEVAAVRAEGGKLSASAVAALHDAAAR